MRRAPRGQREGEGGDHQHAGRGVGAGGRPPSPELGVWGMGMGARRDGLVGASTPSPATDGVSRDYRTILGGGGCFLALGLGVGQFTGLTGQNPKGLIMLWIHIRCSG